MVDVYLKSSIEQYRAVIDHAEQLDVLLAQGDTKKLVQYTTRLQQLQEEAGLLDREFLASSAQELPHWQSHPLYQERLQLLQQILTMNAEQLPRISGMKAIVAAELSALKVGRGVVSGYGTTLKNNQRTSRGKG